MSTEEIFNWGKDRKLRNSLIIELGEKGVNQQDICKKLNPQVSQGTVSNVLNGKSIVKTKNYSSLKMNYSQIVEYSDVNTIYDDITSYTTMVISGWKKSLLITGMSGMGKSKTVQDTLDLHEKIRGIDYIKIRGKITPLGLYVALYHNRNGLLIIDDSDSVWDNEDSNNILKHALDTSEERIINWTSSKEIKNPLFNPKDENSTEEEYIPPFFEFTGSIIFISNKFKHELDPAFLTRTLKIDLNLTLEDTITRIEQILPNIRKDVSIENKKKALDFMKKIIDETDECKIDVSIRSYIDILDMMLHGSDNWKRLALQQCMK